MRSHQTNAIYSHVIHFPPPVSARLTKLTAEYYWFNRSMHTNVHTRQHRTLPPPPRRHTHTHRHFHNEKKTRTSHLLHSYARTCAAAAVRLLATMTVGGAKWRWWWWVTSIKICGAKITIQKYNSFIWWCTIAYAYFYAHVSKTHGKIFYLNTF